MSDTNNALVERKPDTPLAVQLKDKQQQFHAALPAHIPTERFTRVVLTAIQQNPALARADRASLWNACMRAAADGLLPDNRDGALVIYSTRKGDDWIDTVQWMPMIAGLRKKIRNSGEIRDLDVVAVHAKDAFEYERGDAPYIKHRPYTPKPLPRFEKETDEQFAERWKAHADHGPLVAVYSVATFKDGGKSRDVMTRAEVEYVRDTYSKKNRKGEFSPAWVKSFDEMAKKTVVRRHAKTLPLSSDLDDLIRRDDALYDLSGKSDRAGAVATPKDLNDRLDMLAGPAETELPPHDEETGEVIEGTTNEDSAAADHVTAETKGAEASASSKAASAPDAAKKADPKPEPKKDAPKASPKATEAHQQASSPAADKQTPSAEDRRKALLADLVKQGDEHAANGPRDLEEWLDGLNGDETALLSHAQVKAWKNEAGRAGQ
jgi:recombination protein RecT